MSEVAGGHLNDIGIGTFLYLLRKSFFRPDVRVEGHPPLYSVDYDSGTPYSPGTPSPEHWEHVDMTPLRGIVKKVMSSSPRGP